MLQCVCGPRTAWRNPLTPSITWVLEISSGLKAQQVVPLLSEVSKLSISVILLLTFTALKVSCYLILVVYSSYCLSYSS